jgi:hypothetical protein
MTDAGWYKAVSESSLEQGDILPGCPVPTADREANEIVTTPIDLVVMTQTCDLVQNKVREILLAEYVAYDALLADPETHHKARSAEFRKQAIAGLVPGYSLLHKRTESPPLSWSLVDFHRLHVLEKKDVEVHSVALGMRLRIISPYKEHLSQAFARFFMRVGLPHEAKGFVDDFKSR